jgi:hypothetical protein
LAVGFEAVAVLGRRFTASAGVAVAALAVCGRLNRTPYIRRWT